MKKIKPDLKVKSFQGRAEYVVNNWLKPLDYITIENRKVRLIPETIEQSETKVLLGVIARRNPVVGRS